MVEMERKDMNGGHGQGRGSRSDGDGKRRLGRRSCGIGSVAVVPRRAAYAIPALLFLCIHLVIFRGIGTAGLPAVSQMATTDVTPGSFAVAWVASEPATGGLTVYQGDCTSPINGLVITSEANDTTGNIRATVSGLTADTAYCYQTITTSKSTSEVSLHPQAPVAVTTARGVKRVVVSGPVNIPLANDLLRFPSAAGEGVLGSLAIDGAGGPLSLLLPGDVSRRYVNGNNLFSAATGETLNLTGGERVRVEERYGRSACVIERFRKVPADQETTRIRDLTASPTPQDIDFNGTVNILDILRVAGGRGKAKGDICFNSDLDMTADDQVDSADIQAIIVSFDAAP